MFLIISSSFVFFSSLRFFLLQHKVTKIIFFLENFKYSQFLILFPGMEDYLKIVDVKLVLWEIGYVIDIPVCELSTVRKFLRR